MGNFGKLVLYGDLHKQVMAELPQLGFKEIARVQGGDLQALGQQIRDAEALALRYLTVPDALLQTAKKLKVVSRHGVGTDNINLQLLSKKGVPVWTTGSVNSNSVAEHALMLMLSCAKSGNFAHSLVSQGQFLRREALAATEVSNKSLLVVGYGRIGKRLVELASGFQMQILVCDPYAAVEGAVERVELMAGLRRADFVSLHIPSMGRPVIGKAQLDAMKPSACMINTSRGDLIDLDDLYRALADNRIAGAGLDVFPDEPPQFHPLFELPNVTLSPHSAAMTDDCMRKMGEVTLSNILRSLNGELDEQLVANAQELRAVG